MPTGGCLLAGTPRIIGATSKEPAMFHRIQVLAAFSLGITLVACSTPPAGEEQPYVARETITGSNIPRKDAQVKSGITTVEKDSVENVFTNMPGIRPKSN
jgi:hypothetical protein